MRARLIEKSLVPLDKSWLIRIGLLDITHGESDINNFLDKQKQLGDDLVALQRVGKSWPRQRVIDVGESATIYRFFQFAAWKLNLDKKFVVKGTLKRRAISRDPTIIKLGLKDLLKLDDRTSQWASAAVLMGSIERVPKPPYKLKLTFAALRHWQNRRRQGEPWLARHDSTIIGQALTFIKLYNGGHPQFIPSQAEDYCFGRMFKFITKAEGAKRWPSLRSHESNRIIEIEKVISQLVKQQTIRSKDHRVVQAAAMYQILHGWPLNIAYPQSVAKSWPQFWKFLDFVKKLRK